MTIAVVAVAYLRATTQIPEFEYVRFEPGRLYGYAIGFALLFASVALFFRNDVSTRRWQPNRQQLVTVGVLVAMLLTMLPLISYLGMVVTFTLGGVAMSRFLGWGSLPTAVVSFGAVNLGLFLLFTQVFGIYLPPGRLLEPLWAAVAG